MRREYPTTEADLRKDPVYGPILFPSDGTGPIDLDQLAKELHDLRSAVDRGSEVVSFVTGDRMCGLTGLGGGIYTLEAIKQTIAEEQASSKSLAAEDDLKRPLTVSIDGGLLVLSIGIDTLCFAAEHSPEFYDGEKDAYVLKVTDSAAFAAEVSRALQHEEENGSTPVAVLLDAAFVEAVEDGCQGVEYPVKFATKNDRHV